MDIDLGMARRLVRAAFNGTVTLVDLRPLAGGTVNAAFLLDLGARGLAVLRIAPSEEEALAGPSWLTARGLRRELAAIGALEEIAGLLPRTLHLDVSRSLIDRDWVIQSVVPGRPWSEVDAGLADAQRLDLWRQAGRLCRAIHAVSGTAFGQAGEEGFALWSDVLVHDALGFISDAHRFGFDATLMQRLHRAVLHQRAQLDRISTPSLIHSDLGPRHLFVSPTEAGSWRISGVIDVEFARFADPLAESQIVIFDLIPPDGTCQNAFWRGYGPVAPVPGREIRAVIYQAIALGWVITDLARLDRRDEIPPVAVELSSRLQQLEAGD